VFWVHANNAARLEEGFRDIADAVKLAGRKDPQADVFKLVHDWLRDERKGKWLLVLDNADDVAVLSPVSRYLPSSRHGAVIVTSRTVRATSSVVEDGDVVPIRPMQNDAARALLHKKLGGEIELDGTAELAAALEHIPLALVQAAAYIKMRAPRCSVQEYLGDFRSNDERKTSLLDYKAGSLRRDKEANNSIIITWQISFVYMRKVRESAANLLSLMSFFDRQGIPERLLYGYEEQQLARSSPGLSEESRESDQDDCTSQDRKRALEDDIDILREYSFISPTTGDAFEMHSLVQLATRRWLESQAQLERWKQQYIANLCAEFPPGDYENWARCQPLFPHAMAVLEQRPESEIYLKKWARLLCNAADYARRRGNAGKADMMAVLSMEVRERLLGKEDIETLESMALVGLVKVDQGRWKEAEELQVRVMETRKRVLGEEHPGTLNSIGDLAITFQNQGRWKEVEELEVWVLETRKRVLGDEHPSTLLSMANLASNFWNQGRWKEAEELEVQVLETRKKVLGDEHPDTLLSMSNLAVTFWNQDRLKEAEELQVRVLETNKRVLGDEHPSTLLSITNLASNFWNQGRWKEAEELEVRVVETNKRVLGDEHPNTLTSITNLALTFWNQGRWKEAEELQVRVLETRKRVLGDEHPNTLSSIGNLALTFRNQGRWKEAEELQVRVLETSKRVLENEHPSTLTSMWNLACTLEGQGLYSKAILLLEECSRLQQHTLGPEHPDTVLSLKALQIWRARNVSPEAARKSRPFWNRLFKGRKFQNTM
jgi:hypothetical protein